VPIADSIRRVYKVFLIALVKIIAIAMVLVGILILLFAIADNCFHLGLGYPWWSIIGLLGYIAVSVVIYKATPSFLSHIDRRLGDRVDNRTDKSGR
jgi:hypothetical protein